MVSLASGPDTRPASSVCDLFNHQVRRRPHATALRTPHRSWTFAELGDVTARLAERLRRLDAGPGALVGLLAHGGPAAVIGLLATVRCGAACMPLDPDDPPRRNQQILADAGCRQVLAASPVHWCPEAQLIDDPSLATEAAHPARLPAPHPLALAYAITTSGSTGRPKAVAVPHEALVNLVVASIDDVGLVPEQDVVLWLSRPTVDVTMQDCFMALCSGATLAVPEHGDFLPGSVLTAARRLAATVVDIPAAVVSAYGEYLLPRLARAGVRFVIAGGSRLDGAGLAGVIDSLVVLNAYGPTETAVTATVYRCHSATPRWVPIGRPIRGVRTYVLDEELAPVPAGAPGELYIGGVGLARGYLGQPGRTAAVFLPDPFAGTHGQRMYATGDRVRLRADGDLDYLDRIDNQVKVRGFRIEIGEVEHVLRELPGVVDAAVVVRDDAPGGAALVAFLVGGQCDDDVLRMSLRDRLPSYMVPAFFVWRSDMPLNRRGKVDRAALATTTIQQPGG